jgi:hypothetical protein
MTAKRKEETCEEQLRRHCKSIAMDITDGKEDASSWMEGTYDIRYLVGSDKEYLGAQLMVAGGGPTIWVNTWTNDQNLVQVLKLQAASIKRQATSHKLRPQATSYKLRDP